MRSPWFALADGLSHLATLLASMNDEMLAIAGSMHAVEQRRARSVVPRLVGRAS